MDFNRLFPLSSLYFEPLSGRAVDSHVEHRRLGFVALARRHASHLVGLRSSSTVGNYLTALRSFSSFLGGTDVSLGAVTSRLVCGYARWLADRGVTRNTASCYLRSLRTLYRAVGSHARGGGNRPFADVFTGNVPTAKRAASVADMRRICSLRLPKGSRLQLAHDLFVFSFCAMGMPFVDVVRLRRSQVRGRYMVYTRQKTGRSVVVRIEPCMRAILRRYESCGGDYAFPVLPQGVVGEALHRAYLTALGRYNRALKRLAVLAGVAGRLSSYVPRHTWATQAYAHRVEMAVIAQALGHANTRTTWTYVRQTGNGVLAAANRKIIREIVLHTSGKEVCESG